MQAIRYEAPQSVAEAVRLIAADPGARILAGGTDLLVQVRAGARQPSAYIDIKRIPDLLDITIDARELRLGAATPAAAICEDVLLSSLWPGLSEAVHLIGSTQIQGRGSVGGNLCNASPAADYDVRADREPGDLRHCRAQRRARSTGRRLLCRAWKDGP